MATIDSALPTVRALVFEDESAVSGLLVRFLQSEPRMVVQARVRTLSEGIAALAGRPNLAIVDWMLTDGTCLELLRAIRAMHSACRVLVFSANTSNAAVRQALAAGALGYVERSASFAELVTALRTVAAGQTYVTPAIAAILRRPETVASPPDLEALTLRERDVLRLVGEGFASKQIAALFGLSVRTVENHRAAIMRKTGLHSAAQLAVHAVQLGLVERAIPMRQRGASRRQSPVG